MKKNGFIEGAVIATIAVVITKILGMLYVIPFYKIIGPAGGALYSYAYNIYMIFLGISSIGIPTAISKIVSEYNTLGYMEAKNRTFILGKRIIGYLSIIAFIIMFIFAGSIAKTIIGDMTGGNSIQDVTFVIRCISFAILVIPYLSVTKGYIQGHSIVTPSSISNIIEQLVRIFIILSGSFLAYKVFSSTVTMAVGISVTGAFFGGLAAYLYLNKKIKQNKKTLEIQDYTKKDAISNKEIFKKIIGYSVPFIIINIAINIYNFVDMILIIRGLNILHFPIKTIEFIQSAITTWSLKICMIISSLAMGMSVSLIPNMVKSLVKNDWVDINKKLNKAYQIILVISIPCAVGLSILSEHVWRIFYGESVEGPIILSLMVISAIIANLYYITFNTMQSLNKYRVVYVSVIVGLLLNALLDIPLILVLHKLGLPAYLGTIIATMIGYIISIKIATHNLKIKHNFKFSETYKMGVKIMIPVTIMAIILFILNYIFKGINTSYLNSLVIIIVNSLIGGTIYIVITYKMGILNEIFGKEYLNKIIKKLTFNKVSIKD